MKRAYNTMTTTRLKAMRELYAEGGAAACRHLFPTSTDEAIQKKAWTYGVKCLVPVKVLARRNRDQDRKLIAEVMQCLADRGIPCPDVIAQFENYAIRKRAWRT